MSNHLPFNVFWHDFIFVDVLKVGVDAFAAEILNRHQAEIVKKTVELADAAAQLEAEKQLASVASARTKLAYENELHNSSKRLKPTSRRRRSPSATSLRRLTD